MTFKIPDHYERKWKSFDVNDGVLEIMYTRDTDDNSIPFNAKFNSNDMYKFDLENNITN